MLIIFFLILVITLVSVVFLIILLLLSGLGLFLLIIPVVVPPVPVFLFLLVVSAVDTPAAAGLRRSCTRRKVFPVGRAAASGDQTGLRRQPPQVSVGAVPGAKYSQWVGQLPLGIRPV